MSPGYGREAPPPQPTKEDLDFAHRTLVLLHCTLVDDSGVCTEFWWIADDCTLWLKVELGAAVHYFSISCTPPTQCEYSALSFDQWRRVYCHHNLAPGGGGGWRLGDDHQGCSNKGRRWVEPQNPLPTSTLQKHTAAPAGYFVKWKSALNKWIS